MIRNTLSFLCFVVVSFNLTASETKFIDTGELSFKKVGERFEAVIEGYRLDKIGEKPALPFKKLFFKKPVESVEIVSSRIVKAPGKLQKGNPFYRISPEGMKKVILSEETLTLPGLDNFYESEFLGFKLGVPTYKFRFSPLIPLGNNKYMHIRKIKIRFGEKPLFQIRPSTDNKKSLLIITTREIRNRSAKLSEFVAAKRQHGFTVDVATEDEFGGRELLGQDKAIVVRDWLKSVHSKYRFLLIIASPVPGSKGIPMITKEQQVPNYSGSTTPQYESIPTDTFYSELYADWDSDEDGIIGGQRDRGISFQYQLVTGRIPVYNSSDVSKLDEILEKTIYFMNESPDTPYRKNILIPASIAYFENQDNMGYPQMDGAYVAEYIENNFLEEPFKLDILVEKEGLSTSEFTDFPALNYSSMEEYLNRGNGVVFWQGHGLPTLTVRTIWGSDTNSNEIPDSRELQSTTFVDSSMALRVSRDKPGFIYEGSCLNGKAEVSDNLGYTMLQGPGIGVVASTRVTYGGINKNYNPDVYQ
ncbi:MAG: C25 family cysteine peptidase, partial [bacterium]